jgi:hypothetical protein
MPQQVNPCSHGSNGCGAEEEGNHHGHKDHDEGLVSAFC